MVHCGHCNNNTCNGGTEESCPDRCASAREFEKTNNPPDELKERELAVQAEWDSMTPEQRDEHSQKLFDEAFRGDQ